MLAIATEIGAGLQQLDEHHRTQSLAPAERLLRVVTFACAAFERFLAIHPFANGNGHASRFLIWAILGRYQYWPEDWTIEPRPGHPDYLRLILAHRNGDTLPLITAVLQSFLN
jgi:Fic family protein